MEHHNSSHVPEVLDKQPINKHPEDDDAPTADYDEEAAHGSAVDPLAQALRDSPERQYELADENLEIIKTDLLDESDAVEFEKSADHADASLAATQNPKLWSMAALLTFCKSESFLFAARVAVSLTLSSLMVLCFSASDPYPEGIWVYTTAAVTSWLPSRDTATAFRKLTERSIGTIIGACLGLMVGFLSLAVEGEDHQRILLGVSIASEAFVFPFLADKYGYRKSYAAMLTQITFGIVALSFYQEDADHPWKKGCYRVLNIFLGCGIGGLAAIGIGPVSTKTLLLQKADAQMKLAGRSAQHMLLSACQSFVHKSQPPMFLDILRKNEPVQDETYKAYVSGMNLWKDCKTLFPMLGYDPFYRWTAEEARGQFKEDLKNRVARSFLIQNTVVMMDTIVRGAVAYRDPTCRLESLLCGIGERISLILDASKEKEERNRAAKDLMEVDMVRIREYLSELRNMASTKRYDAQALHHAWSSFDGSRPIQSLESREQIVLFFEMLEHLVLRSVRQHYYCVEKEIE
jgi:hypothetical protein